MLIERYDITVRELSFGNLKEINLHIPEGKKVGVIGRTGSGKSTLLNLLMKVHVPPPGKIFLGGIDILEIPDPVFKRIVGGVLQENFFFSMSIRDNLRIALNKFGREEVASSESDEEILRVLEFSELDVNEFVGKIDEIVGERGTRLSGGQKARLALARAIIKKPKILVLDDPFASLDMRTEKKIQEKILATDSTVILASHRVTFMKSYDIIICIEDGRIVDVDTPQNLLARDSMFRRFHTLMSDWIG